MRIKGFIIYFVNALNNILPGSRFFSIKRFLYRKAGVVIGENVRLMDCKIMKKGRVVIGRNTFIGSQSVITGGVSDVIIGDYCDISSYVRITTGTHEIDVEGVRVAGKGLSKRVLIGDGVWIGMGVIILPGVKIGKKTVIGAGSVVVHDIPAYTVAVGVPCKPIKSLK